MSTACVVYEARAVSRRSPEEDDQLRKREREGERDKDRQKERARKRDREEQRATWTKTIRLQCDRRSLDTRSRAQIEARVPVRRRERTFRSRRCRDPRYRGIIDLPWRPPPSPPPPPPRLRVSAAAAVAAAAREPTSYSSTSVRRNYPGDAAASGVRGLSREMTVVPTRKRGSQHRVSACIRAIDTRSIRQLTRLFAVTD